MTTALLVLLVAVFGLAGTGKLTDREGTVAEMVSFGVPERFAPAMARVLPVVELAVAVALVVPATRHQAAAGALVLLLGYTAAIAGNMALGREPECRCFGPLYVTPVGPKSLLRNILFSAAAVLLLVRL